MLRIADDDNNCDNLGLVMTRNTKTVISKTNKN